MQLCRVTFSAIEIKVPHTLSAKSRSILDTQTGKFMKSATASREVGEIHVFAVEVGLGTT